MVTQNHFRETTNNIATELLRTYQITASVEHHDDYSEIIIPLKYEAFISVTTDHSNDYSISVDGYELPEFYHFNVITTARKIAGATMLFDD